MKQIAVFVVILIWCICGLCGNAKAKKWRWYIVKTKDGVCRVIEADAKTPQTIGGPYKTEQNAYQAKSEVCAARDLPSDKKQKSKKADVKSKSKKKQTRKKTTAKKSSQGERKTTKDSDSQPSTSVIKKLLIDVIKKMDF
jgi:hypothetical protein